MADSRRANVSSAGAGIDFYVIDCVGVHPLDLVSGGANRAVTASSLAALQIGGGAVHTHEDDVNTGHHSQQIRQPPWLTEDMIHHDVVARQRHSRNGAVKPSASAVQYFTQGVGIKFVGLLFSTHRSEHVDSHVKPGALEVSQKLARNRGLARTGGTVEQYDLPRCCALCHYKHSAPRGSPASCEPRHRGTNVLRHHS